MKKAVVTGGTGFLGYWLLKELTENGIFSYVVQRKNSSRKNRLDGMSNIGIIELSMDEIQKLPDLINESCDVFYNLAWEGERNDMQTQMENIVYSLNAVHAAKKAGCKRIVFTGSQAEYGLHDENITEETPTNPHTAYGACKLAACHMTRILAKQQDIEWVWTRVFSLYGIYDHPNTLISFIMRELYEDRSPNVTSAVQNWDYLHVADAARALHLLGTQGAHENVYNLASGQNKILKEYINIVQNIVNKSIPVNFGSHNPDEPIVKLNTSIERIKNAIGWEPRISFVDGIHELLDHMKGGNRNESDNARKNIQ